MENRLSVLNLEDNAAEAELIRRSLQSAGLVFDWKVAADKAEFVEALEKNSFDIILSDHRLPQFSSEEALRMIKEKNLDVAFILVTGAVSEEFAVNILHQGADDYILKNNLQRLPSAITNAIEKHKSRRAQQEYEEKIRQSENKYRHLFENNPMPMWIMEPSSFRFLAVNEAAVRHYGYSREEFLSMTTLNIRPEEEKERYRTLFRSQDEIHRRWGIWKHTKKDGTLIDVEIISHEIGFGDMRARLVLSNDVTEKLKAEKELKDSQHQLRQLSAHLQSIREDERTTIAREIHDELGQQLTALKMDLAWLNKRITDAAAKERIAGMVSIIDQTVKTVRRISSQLRPGILDDLGLVAALDWQSHEFEKRTGIQSSFVAQVDDENFERALASGIFRVFQETLTNVARHSQATRVQSSLIMNGDKVILTIADNGKGFNEASIKGKKTLGLVGMRERAIMMGGTLNIESGKKGGTQVILNVPFKTEAPLSPEGEIANSHVHAGVEHEHIPPSENRGAVL